MARDRALALPLIASIRPVLEGLEDRRLLAASLEGGVLTIDGTAGKDSITVSMNSAGSRYTVTIGKDDQNFKAGNVDRIVIDGGEGNDKIRFNEKSHRIGVKTVINGGDGNDRIFGSTRNDNIKGGSGRDLILGGKGNDRLSGESKDDTVFGDASNDVIFGGSGNDILGGDDEGVFVIKGESIPKQVSGNDRLDGGDGDDWLLGGIRYERGPDDQQTGTNALLIIEDDDTDTMTGGEGVDVLDVRGADDEIINLESQDTVPSRELRTGSQTMNHIHVQLNIRIRNGDGSFSRVIVPHAIGQFEQGVDAIHTHDQTGNIHYEAADGQPYSIGEFLENWGIAVDRRVFGRTLTSSGAPITAKLIPDSGDKQQIALEDLRDYEPEDGDAITITIG